MEILYHYLRLQAKLSWLVSSTKLNTNSSQVLTTSKIDIYYHPYVASCPVLIVKELWQSSERGNELMNDILSEVRKPILMSINWKFLSWALPQPKRTTRRPEAYPNDLACKPGPTNPIFTGPLASFCSMPAHLWSTQSPKVLSSTLYLEPGRNYTQTSPTQ